MVEETVRRRHVFTDEERSKAKAIQAQRQEERRRQRLEERRSRRERGPDAVTQLHQGDGNSRILFRRLIVDLSELEVKLRLMIRALGFDAKPSEVRALQSALTATTDCVGRIVEAEGGPKGELTYEERMAKAYRDAGLPVPGRL